MHDAVKVELLRQATDDRPDSWTARVGDATFPVVTYSVEPPAEPGGPALVSLLIPADSVHVGDPAVSLPPGPAVPEKPALSTWGAPGRPDPRENIPGWKPDRGGVNVQYTPGDGDRIIGQVREHIRHAGGGSAVTA